MTSYMDYTSPSTQFTFDLNTNPLFRKDANNYINVLGIANLNTLENTSLLDIFLSKSNVVEPHYHQNAAELVYCISGAAVVSLINPFTNELLNFPITPGQVANVPQGWWHYEIATVDHTHLLAIFDAPTPEVILGSDILKITPPEIWAHSYCMDEAKVKDTFAPVQTRTYIGPPRDCKGEVQGAAANKAYPNQLNPVSQHPNSGYPNELSPVSQHPNSGYPNQLSPVSQHPNSGYPNPQVPIMHYPHSGYSDGRYPYRQHLNQPQAQTLPPQPTYTNMAQSAPREPERGYQYPYHMV
ncbi:cupin domain-containing protein [Paenibacillus sp. XY044]|uniref:cupin domain-containing protein n=1 Tax=Paenibacillus sp. XY044 TaxID=2026089 RepID=UPI000B97F312|nr:cupin domain-containing protein [Paenibacillus sp. XY044]OZB98337.1 hypothetical protein CJP46_04045 [Paenibacillus sp. XY044]